MRKIIYKDKIVQKIIAITLLLSMMLNLIIPITVNAVAETTDNDKLVEAVTLYITLHTERI